MALSSSTGAAAVRRVDRDAKRNAVRGVPGELDAPEQAAGVLGRHHDLVRRLAGDVAGVRPADVDVLHQLVQLGLDLRDRRDRFGRGLAGLRAPASAVFPCTRCSTSGRRSRTRRCRPGSGHRRSSPGARAGADAWPSTATGGRWRPDRIGSEPWSAVESIRLSVKLILALIAVTAGAAAAWWSAWRATRAVARARCPRRRRRSRSAGDRDDQPAMIASRRWVEIVRRSFIKDDLSRVLRSR